MDLSRKSYGSVSGELVELLLAPVVYQCLIHEGFHQEGAIRSLCQRVGINEEEGREGDIYACFKSMDEVLTSLRKRWESSNGYEVFHEQADVIKKRVSFQLNQCSDKVEFICQQFENDDLLGVSVSLANMADLPTPILPHTMRDAFECSLLHHVASEDGARLLLSLLPCHSLVNARQQEGFRPIHHATHPNIARYLVVEHGADVNARSRSGFTPLFIVDSAAAAINLLKLGADPMISNTYYRHNALHFTASHGLWDVVWFLLRAGADPTLKGKDGYSPLELCKLLASNPLPSDTDQHIKALIKVKRMLEIWEEVTSLSPLLINDSREWSSSSSSLKPSVNDTQRFEHRFNLFAQRCSDAAHARLCKDPALGLSDATHLPIELTRLILNDYVSVFNGSEDFLMERKALKNNRIRYRRRSNSSSILLGGRRSGILSSWRAAVNQVVSFF